MNLQNKVDDIAHGPTNVYIYVDINFMDLEIRINFWQIRRIARH